MTDGGSDKARAQTGKPKRGGLGRGLESLIPSSSANSFNATSDLPSGPLREVSIDEISPNPFQPRSHLNLQKLEDLADSIRRHGLMQPLVVAASQSGEGWILIAGERRWRASRIAGLTSVPVVIMEAAPQAMLELAIVENVVRADLGPLEEASAFRQLIKDFGLSQSDVAERVGRSRASVANTLRLLGAPDRVREALTSEQITEGHARAILGLTNAVDQLAVLAIVIDKGLNVRQSESLVRQWLSDTPKERVDSQTRDPDEIRIEDKLRSALGTRVALRKGSRGSGGSLTIQFFSDDQLQSIYDRLVGEELW